MNTLVLLFGLLQKPQTNVQGEIRAFETIAYNSRKYALKDAQKSGLSTTLGELKNGEPIILAEGYATGATLHENAGKKAVVISFGKNGLLDTAKSLRERYPDSKIYIGADNDHAQQINAGLIDAKAVEKLCQTLMFCYHSSIKAIKAKIGMMYLLIKALMSSNVN